MDAGTGAGWHVHKRDHVKFGDLDGTRINFAGLSASQVQRKMRAIHTSCPVGGGVCKPYVPVCTCGRDNYGFGACMRWVAKNLK